jgi:hypothetical protein
MSFWMFIKAVHDKSFIQRIMIIITVKQTKQCKATSEENTVFSKVDERDNLI